MLRRQAVLAFLILSATSGIADDAVFSGPQVGEKLPSFEATGVFGDLTGKTFDAVKNAGDKPVALIFVHARTRPAFGLTNLVMKYAATRSKAGLTGCVVFLTDDATSTERWMNQVEKHFPKGVTYGISPDGLEGPGALGLNRNVTLTILVGQAGKVVANFALVQPSVQADGPKILKAIAEVSGDEKVPSIEDLSGPRYRGRKARETAPKATERKNDPKLTSLLRAVINRQASVEDVNSAATEVEEYVEKNESARRDLARITHTVVNSGRLTSYGTEAAQKKLKEWAKKFAVSSTDESADRDRKAKPADEAKNE